MRNSLSVYRLFALSAAIQFGFTSWTPNLFANGERQPDQAVYLEASPLPASIGLGLASKEHKLGAVGSRIWGKTAYKSLGLQYAYHPAGAMKSGFYSKLFVERRWFDPGLEVNSRYSEGERAWKSDTLQHHVSDHAGAIIGHQWTWDDPQIYAMAGLGWQFNSNPVDTGPTVFGLHQSIKSRSEATGELALGYFFSAK